MAVRQHPAPPSRQPLKRSLLTDRWCFTGARVNVVAIDHRVTNPFLCFTPAPAGQVTQRIHTRAAQHHHHHHTPPPASACALALVRLVDHRMVRVLPPLLRKVERGELRGVPHEVSLDRVVELKTRQLRTRTHTRE